MRSIKEILLPTDFSPRSVDVARYAAGVARHFNSHITLLHVLPPINPAVLAVGNAGLTQEVMVRQKEETCNRLKQFLADEFKEFAVRRIVLEGDPAEAITSFAAEEHVGLVMMPTRGCSAFRRFLLGSVTAKVLHDVACPVWTSSHIVEGRSRASAIPKVIVCAIDRNPEGDQILQWASDLASELGASLVATHAISSLEFQPETYYLEAEMRRKMIGDVKASIGRVLHASRTPDAELRVDGGYVSSLVRSAIEDHAADLLIIGRASGRGMLGRLRTHSYVLIRESPCPVISI
ncbi:MAG: universal stress protein [Ignavibacteriota bacterium]